MVEELADQVFAGRRGIHPGPVIREGRRPARPERSDGEHLGHRCGELRTAGAVVAGRGNHHGALVDEFADPERDERRGEVSVVVTTETQIEDQAALVADGLVDALQGVGDVEFVAVAVVVDDALDEHVGHR